ncbi:hypothetical protein [Gordonia sp. (in: high G+C Gram-positive bacteria)]|uniref:hypothetical protein n=1 Tax=Gordonia sp. (in: high G+C Gram-positive bacteria) TaxID=84139 RepID=UPI0016AF663B|nr:hypothetical protein [Gordonia sp. (in: high G+C Gram-positive bacteria)]NLG47717.1 hypothetical protein [Gordonia sp. (in: high G+C Gram-positive bacteria)]
MSETAVVGATTTATTSEIAIPTIGAPPAGAPAETTGAGKPTPVLGRDEHVKYAVGFGTVKPTGFSLASTASSTVGNITWESWGPQVAIGQGTSQQNGPSNPLTVTWLRADDVGWCDGVWAYRRLGRLQSREQAMAGGGRVADICQGDTSAPPAPNAPGSGGVTLSPSSLLTFGGAGGVYVGDPASKIPNTYVKKVVATLGAYPPGSTFYYFREPTSSAMTDWYFFARPDGVITSVVWGATDRGIKVGSTRADVAKAYAGFPAGHCRTSSLNPADFYRDPATGRNVIFLFDSGGTVSHMRAQLRVTDGQHCGFE